MSLKNSLYKILEMQCRSEYDEGIMDRSGRDEIVIKQNENKKKGDVRVTQ